MILKGSYDSVGDVPQEFKDSFKEVEGKFVFTGQIETKDAADYKELHKLKQSSFDDMHGLKEQLKAETQSKVDIQNKLEIAELKIQNGADLDNNESIQELVAKKLKAKTADLTTQLAEANEKNEGYQNTIHGSEKEKFVDGLLDNFSADVKLDAIDILDGSFERQADGSYLTKKTKDFDAGLTSEQAIPKLLARRMNWQKQNASGGAGGGDGGGINNGQNKEPQTMNDIVADAWAGK